jgi:hypothetical protein
MSEKKLIISGLKLNYVGLFNLHELYSIIERYFKDMGYDKDDKKHEVKVFKEGKTIDIDMRPYRSVSDYAKLVIKMVLSVQDAKDVVVKIDGKDVKLQEGKISFTFDGFVITDYEKRWVTNAMAYFFRVLIDKYLYSGYIKEFDDLCREDINLLYNEISSHLNINKYRYSEVL